MTEGRKRLTAGSSDLMGLAFQPARTRSCRRMSLARATVRNGNGDKISMSTSSSDVGSSFEVGMTIGCGFAATVSCFKYLRTFAWASRCFDTSAEWS